MVVNFKHRNPLILNQSKSFLTITNFETFACLLACLIYFLSFFSNSFVVNEDSLLLFLVQSLLWMYCVTLVLDLLRSADFTSIEHKNKRQKVPKTFDIMRFLTHPTMLVIIVTCFVSLVLRISSQFSACREEKSNCEISMFLLPLGNLVNQLEKFKNARYFFSVTCLALIVILTRQWMKHYGNLNGASISVLCVRYFCPMAAVCLCVTLGSTGLTTEDT